MTKKGKLIIVKHLLTQPPMTKKGKLIIIKIQKALVE